MTSKRSGTKSSNRSAAAPESVEAFLSSLRHPFRQDILALRQIITIAESIKWKAPSFYTSEHFATMNLRAKTGVGVIMHFGAKKNDISTRGVTIRDPDSLLEWLSKDRAMVTFRDLNDIAARGPAFTNLIREWIKHV